MSAASTGPVHGDDGAPPCDVTLPFLSVTFNVGPRTRPTWQVRDAGLDERRLILKIQRLDVVLDALTHGAQLCLTSGDAQPNAAASSRKGLARCAGRVHDELLRNAAHVDAGTT